MMPTSHVASFWMKLEKSFYDHDFVKKVLHKSDKKITLTDEQGLPITFRMVLGGLAALTSVLLILRVVFTTLHATVYSHQLQIAFDITLAVVTPLSAVYLHRLLKARITKQVEEYKTLFIENPHAMWVYDVNTLKFLMVNDAAVALYGYTSEEFLRMKVSDIRPMEDVPAFLIDEENRRTHSLSRYHWSGTWRHKTKQRKEIYAEVSSYEMTFNGKRAALALSYDVTDKVLQELKLITLNQELELKVKDRTNDLLFSNRTLVNQNNTIRRANQELAKVTEALQVANEKLKEHAESKSQFVSTVSHEFRSPLSSIKFAAEFVQRNHNRLSKAQILERTKSISHTVGHMEVLLNDILIIQRGESPKILPNAEGVNIEAFVKGIANEVLHATKQTHEIRLKTDCLPEKINSDEKLLRNIFLNLLTNAIKYSGDSKIVHFLAKRNGESISFEITDHGIGIDPACMEKIFEPFYRTPAVKDIQGTGLGLSIVKRAVDALGGKISVKSELGGGSTFIIVLPVKSDI